MDSVAPEIRRAATLILVRDAGTAPRVLMGRRSDSAVFLPGAYVFPGGAIEPIDQVTEPDHPLNPICAARLGSLAPALAAVRELREETGFRFAGGLDLRPLRYVFRAITPAGFPRRFDTAFFLADAAALDGDLDDIRPEDPELSDLHWVSPDRLSALKLPSITRIVLRSVVARLPSLEAPVTVPEVGL